ncbi:hypothetical protein U2F26_31135 [Micromonospora sp. 4G57]|uniref:Uncharacterized protein n=1 Tax=Micromonospora sicca TaxID=2202420 RepID=A0ABU5JM61_9ACTN|nr:MULTISPECIES: hypothetical protein [unclassified Micromonospora]MDZ5447120.1 hypothetical protein [Micromonospora sp. 4G57]MDZ5493722.1 hypothetical protein [Micromonospora sp. 4G53]
MGSRVNYVLVRDGRSERYAQGGGAGYGLDYHFAAGPDIALRWLAQLHDYRDDVWFDDLSCEGGVLIDVDARHLLLFTELGQFSLEQRYAYRAGLLDAYRRTWGGWTVSWAYDGIGDLVAYLGEEPDQVRSERAWWDGLYPDGGQRPDGPVEYLVSVADAGRCRPYALPVESCPPWRLGPRLLDRLDPRDLVTACSTHPTAGLHLDVARRRAGLWSIRPLAGLAEDWSELWPGWELELWGDDLSRQVAECGGTVNVPGVDLAAERATLAERVDRYWFVEERMRAAGQDVDQLREWNLGGIATLLDARVTPDELARIVALIRG